MELIVEPEDGLTPVIVAIKKATKEIDVTIFRFDLKELQRALESAVTRGVKVHALIAHTTGGGAKRLRNLELDLLAAGVMVSRTDNDLVRYHNKMVVVDRETLYALAFNFTRLDIDQSRSLGVATKNKAVVAEALKLFEADSERKPYTATCDCFLVSPENARSGLAKFIKSAKKELLIYDMKISDRQMLKLLQDRVKAGVNVRILGKVSKKGEGLTAERMPGMRLHVRAMLRDNRELFLGSMSLRAIELDKRREVGIIVKERAAAKQFRELFEKDWAKTDTGKRAENEAVRAAS
ncbi:MAG TPA: phospholipase D-like domain-containing protein [Vicinamibacterales bacterium]|nr:phospholipase D-like domain-containing protein [Vicinamibacterales bacterium]